VEPTDKRLIVNSIYTHVELQMIFSDEDMEVVKNLQYERSRVIIINCDITNMEESLKFANQTYENLIKLRQERELDLFPLVIAINKCDLIPELNEHNEKQKSSKVKSKLNHSEMQKIYQHYIDMVKLHLPWANGSYYNEYGGGTVPIVFTCAKTRDNIDHLFHDAVRQSRKRFFITEEYKSLIAKFERLIQRVSHKNKQCSLQ